MGIVCSTYGCGGWSPLLLVIILCAEMRICGESNAGISSLWRAGCLSCRWSSWSIVSSSSSSGQPAVQKLSWAVNVNHKAQTQRWRICKVVKRRRRRIESSRLPSGVLLRCNRLRIHRNSICSFYFCSSASASLSISSRVSFAVKKMKWKMKQNLWGNINS